jgi:GntR family transcriptional regulator, rspAB operon transcriptional repressor
MAETYTSLTERALAYLKEKIQNCELMPGEFLSEKRLCEEIGCGRTPVREALLRDEGGRVN